jgi:hypothetical protein
MGTLPGFKFNDLCKTEGPWTTPRPESPLASSRRMIMNQRTDGLGGGRDINIVRRLPLMRRHKRIPSMLPKLWCPLFSISKRLNCIAVKIGTQRHADSVPLIRVLPVPSKMRQWNKPSAFPELRWLGRGLPSTDWEHSTANDRWHNGLPRLSNAAVRK